MAICEKCKSSMVIIKSNTGAKCCMNCGWCSDDNSYKKIQTNADKIRSMSDEELAEFLEGINKGYDISYGDYISMNEGIFISDRKDLSKEILKWLQSEAE